ncbi:glucan 1,3-beta-glucosidase 2 [[Candida] railenensis]|uniref:glucan 1,3-beta-glucosidase n=1 Tax=[Candida] railenensis TaxID=45579 RepID=A0A9P0QSQ7_9ASCO|nr:glucan 1,3-beta-glucosidase 2 [[Candida] railenensis]
MLISLFLLLTTFTRSVCCFNSSYNSTLHPNISQSSVVQPEYNSKSFQYKGVALGGWLLLEPYITPSLFLAFNETDSSANIPVDEYHYCETLGETEASKRLQKHWSTFYNESDFARIKSYGLNMVRIPIGYWAFKKLSSDPYVVGAQEYLDLAIEWANANDLMVWIDLHGVPGTQNGFDNSGYRDIGYPGWFNDTENLDLTYEVLNEIYTKYGDSSNQTYVDTILGIEVVNEPYGPNLNLSTLKEFYTLTYKDARDLQSINNSIIFHDAFQSIGYWNDYLNTTSFSNILIDHHHYEVFTFGALNMTIAEHISSIKSYSSSIESNEGDANPALVGEWSAALTDCAPWVNGVGLGARYAGEQPYDNDFIGECDNINNFKKWTKERKKDYRKYVEIQLDQYENYTMGWIFWCFKTETTIEWDFEKLVQLDLMPQPLSDRKYIVNGTDTTAKKSIGHKLSIGWGALFIAFVYSL